MKLSDYVIDFIVRQGVTHLFEMVGGAIAHLVDSTYERKDIHCVSVHHEQAAAFAAEGYARTSGGLGVAMATSGPGALNLTTGIASCYFDSVPALFITGQVNTYEYKFDRPLRQIGFQETDIVSIVKPITKYAELVAEPSTIRYHLEKAAYLARAGRPGPVLLDIPLNVQRAEIEPEELKGYKPDEETPVPNAPYLEGTVLDDIATLLKQAERPLILVGGGIRAAKAQAELHHFVQHTRIPVVSSLMGLDALSHDNPAFFGLIGSYGNRFSNLALANCDLLLILGSRLDTRQTGTRPGTFARAAKKVHVDTDIHELNEKVQADIALHADVKIFLSRLNKVLSPMEPNDLAGWYRIVQGYRERYPSEPTSTNSKIIDPNTFLRLLSEHCKKDQVICLDVGQHQMWASQSFKVKQGQRLLNSGGLGAMGFALPAAIGSAKARPGQPVIVIAGDGGLQVNIQELETVNYHRLPIKIFVMNNYNLGMVRQFQDVYFQGRQQSSLVGYSCPDFIKVARAYGIRSYHISGMDQAERIIKNALAYKGPVLVHVPLDAHAVVHPKLNVNKPIEDMSPHLERDVLKREMLIDLLEEGFDC
ncbi:thiamine pyrophosphate-binding protein [Paenibacillus alkaliterrae]|uniref:thiamine pyrophosphate-binding protein n=1 Tax=Paenibacillus alkaliterrae TaxID=320909 RepID=UPI001F223AA2|nr:thiamine pyrophosphate-binding protein [Paenibacillus alkaliterrae]MCF2940169.1 thiamine pyrophosphate-binding protein [Paenibacillus alkaliterrae]